MEKHKSIRGITLVALVITIIILLILAGITISQLTGSGLFENAKLAQEKSKNAQEKEEGILADYANKINGYVDGTRSGNPKTILYPNGGTAENPATITTSQRIEIDNPYPGHTLYLVAQVYYNDMWGEAGFVYTSGSSGGIGVKATQIQSNNVDKIIVQSGNIGVTSASKYLGNGFNYSGNSLKELPCRLIVVCLD